MSGTDVLMLMYRWLPLAVFLDAALFHVLIGIERRKLRRRALTNSLQTPLDSVKDLCHHE